MFLRRPVILLVVLTAVLWPATAAQAHDVLKSSNPAKDAKVADISEVTLEFDRAVKFPKVAVLNASGERFQAGEASLRGKKVVQALSGMLPPGKYTIGFRVVSSDGHPRTGEIPFTVIASSTPSPTPTSSATASEAPSTPAPSSAAPSAEPVEPTLIPQANETSGSAGGGSVFLWVVVGLAAVMAAFSIVISRRRRSGR
ncbi:copper resistance CopC family protein [Streptosporangium sp. 'caverna']|uniref:copper resistance CopC family protein n=1 Tax=Streptosporangium sp. 'caverna' TaxID=2202249 RepID=UPI000D7DC8ED|nr:copper resistance CopC family protein [Streptosporangium sp. 'caverna']AWS43784.1 copper resistance protein CopC [Streptosporangium sp. 'caverna']